MAAWPVWDEFRNDALDNGRVVDKSDDRKVTTSEGQSYAMFFALVTNDQVTFDGLAAWTADNLSGGDLTKTLPAWLWGRGRGDKWGILDTNNATDSDMWIAWCFLEAGRLWKSEEYTKKGMAMLELLKKEVRTVDNLGSVVLPGRVGFEDNGTVKLNPSYYPLFLFKRFALEDAYWNEVYEGSLRMLLRSSPAASATTRSTIKRTTSWDLASTTTFSPKPSTKCVRAAWWRLLPVVTRWTVKILLPASTWQNEPICWGPFVCPTTLSVPTLVRMLSAILSFCRSVTAQRILNLHGCSLARPKMALLSTATLLSTRRWFWAS